MTVESKPLKSAQTSTRHRSIAVPVAGLLIGAILWPIGARYTIDGVFWLTNALLGFLHIPYAVATPPHWAFYCLFAWLPYVCSRVEWKSPLTKTDGRWYFAPPDVVVVWALIAAADFTTTYLGLGYSISASAVAAEIAASVAVSVILGLILTFGPEWLIRASWHRLTR